MNTMGERLRAAMDAKGLRPDDLVAKKVLSRAGVYQWLGDTVRPDKVRADTVTKLCKVLGVERDWLLEGKGPRLARPDNLTDSRLPHEPETPSQVLGLDLAKLATAQKFLEDVFAGNGLKFVASEQTTLLAAVYDELMTKSESNLVEMAARFGKRIRGNDGRQREAGSAIADDRGGDGESSKQARTKTRRAG